MSIMTPTRPGRLVEKELFVAVAPQRAFRAFSAQDELERWFVKAATIEPRPGGAWSLRWRDDQVAHGTIVEFDPPRRLVMDWFEGDALGHTRLAVEFIPEADGTRIVLVNSGFGSGDDWDALYDGVQTGWGQALDALRGWLEDGVARRPLVGE